MALTPAQLAAVLAAVKASPTAEAIRTLGDAGALLAWLNGASAVSAWRHGVSGAQVYAAHKPKQYMARSGQERSAFDLMCTQAALDFTQAKVRNGVADIFSGATNSDCRLDIFAAAQELATRAEVALGTTNASVGNNLDMAETVTAVRRNWVGRCDSADVNALIQAE